jgi:hypothetical protein
MKFFTPALLAVVALAAVSCDDGSSTGAPYTLKTCLVSDKSLGSMGEPYVFVYEGQEVKLCCPKCLKVFKSDPMTFLIKLVPPPQVPNGLPN